MKVQWLRHHICVIVFVWAAVSCGNSLNNRLHVTTPHQLPKAELATSYSVTFAAAGGVSPYNWVISQGTMPPGMEIDPVGIMSGVPTSLGKFSFTVEVEDAAGNSADSEVNLTVIPEPLQLVTGGVLAQGQEGTSYLISFSAVGGKLPYTWNISAGTPPPGIALSANGELSGVPTAAGTFDFSVTVTDAAATMASGEFSVTIANPPVGEAPLTYSARTDNCVTGSESGCIASATTGETGSPLSFRLRTMDTVPFAESAAMNSTASDPDFGAYLVMATDRNTNAAVSKTPYMASWLMGSDGAWDAFSQDESLLLAHNSGSGATILYLNAASIHAKTCATISCVSLSGIYTANSGGGDETHLAHGGAWSFSRVSSEPNILYELGAIATQVNKLTICATTSSLNCSLATKNNSLIRAQYVDFASDNPVSCKVIQSAAAGNPTTYKTAWISSFQVADDGSVSYGMTGGYDWSAVDVNNAAWVPVPIDTFIFPQAYNTGKDGFQATAVTGPVGSTEPNWDSACKTSCKDGGVTWTNIGPLAGQGPGFDVLTYRPSQGCTRINTRLGKVYRGDGNSAPAGYLTTNDTIACTRAAKGGPVTYPCRLPDLLTLHEVEQGQDGRYVSFSPTGGNAANPAGQWNSGSLTCQVPSDSWLGAWSSSASYGAGQVVSYGGLFYTASSATGNENREPDTNPSYWTVSEAYCLDYYFDTTSTVVAPCSSYGQCTGHNAAGYLHKYLGHFYNSLLYEQPVTNTAPIVLNPGIALLSAALQGDQHGTYRNSGNLDLTPVFAATTDVPAWDTRYTVACYDELCAFNPSGTLIMYRFGHAFNTGSSANFSTQNNIGVISPLGDLLAFGSDMMGTRGDRLVANSECVSNTRGMYKPAPKLTLQADDTVFPVTGNAGGYIYKTITGGVSSGTTPAGGWNQTVGATVAYGSAVLLNAGSNSCRGDIVILDTLSAQAKP